MGAAHRKNSGRKSDWFRQKCSNLITKQNFFDWAEKVFDGKKVEPHVADGKITMAPVGSSSRTYLFKTLAEFGHGKPVSVADLGGADGETCIVALPLGIVNKK